MQPKQLFTEKDLYPSAWMPGSLVAERIAYNLVLFAGGILALLIKGAQHIDPSLFVLSIIIANSLLTAATLTAHIFFSDTIIIEENRKRSFAIFSFLSVSFLVLIVLVL